MNTPNHTLIRWILSSFILMLIPGIAGAIDIANAKKINQRCALCHGIYGQGTPGTLSPRISGLPAKYIAKELRYYRDGTRTYAPMVLASRIKSMTDKDIEDISQYLAGINLRNLGLPKVPRYHRGNRKKGARIFREECHFCHGKTAQGKPKKGAPPLVGQYGSYLFKQMNRFRERSRYHDDDPEDDTFEDYEEKDYDNLVAYLTSLPIYTGQAGMAGMAGMEGMMGMMRSMASMLSMMGGMESMAGARANLNIAGHFRITPTGEIVLNPLNQDMRAVAGLSGDFRITSEGIVFIPKPQ